MSGSQKAGVWILCLSAVVLLGIFIDNPKPRHHFPKYSTLLCDDAFDSTKTYTDPTLPYVDIELAERGCFGGWVTIPNWRNYRMQMLHNEPDAWVAIWANGRLEPSQPRTIAEFNAGIADSYNYVSTFRFQGRGTLRIFNVAKQ